MKMSRGGNPCTVGEMRRVHPLGISMERLFKELKIAPPYEPAVPCLGVHPKETKPSLLLDYAY